MTHHELTMCIRDNLGQHEIKWCTIPIQKILRSSHEQRKWGYCVFTPLISGNRVDYIDIKFLASSRNLIKGATSWEEVVVYESGWVSPSIQRVAFFQIGNPKRKKHQIFELSPSSLEAIVSCNVEYLTISLLLHLRDGTWDEFQIRISNKERFRLMQERDHLHSDLVHFTTHNKVEKWFSFTKLTLGPE